MSHLKKVLAALDDAKESLIEAWHLLEAAEHKELEGGETDIERGGGDAFDQIGVAMKHIRLAKAQLRSFETAEVHPSRAHEGGLQNPPPTHVQTIIFAKEHWSVHKARRWLREHNFKAAKVDVKERTWRFRQRDPGDFKAEDFRVIRFGEPELGIEAVIGHLK